MYKFEGKDRFVLIVGGAGYVGNIMTQEMVSEGAKVRVLDNLIYGHSMGVEALYDRDNIEFMYGDFCDDKVIDKALEGITDVVLLGSLVGDPISKKYPELTNRTNVDGSKKLFKALNGRGIDRFIFTSTCSNYGLVEDGKLADENTELKPLSLYAETKVEFENFVIAEKDNIDFTPTLLRISTAFGLSPRMRFDLTVNEFIFHLAKGKKLDVYDKDTWRPYCHIKDLSRAAMLVLAAPKEKVSGEVFNVGSDENNYTKAMIIDEIKKHIDVEVNYVDGGFDARNYKVSFKKIKDTLGFQAQYSVADYVPKLISAVQSELFQNVEIVKNHYGNYLVESEEPLRKSS